MSQDKGYLRYSPKYHIECLTKELERRNLIKEKPINQNICVNCKYWTRFDDDFYNKSFGICSSDKFIEKISSKNPKDTLVYWDGEGYLAGFETGESFGCIHFML